MSTFRPVFLPTAPGYRAIKAWSFPVTVLVATVVVSLGLTSCTTVRTGGEIVKVNPYHLNADSSPDTDQQMIDFEYRRKVYGAVTTRDFKERYGNYFDVHWRTSRCDLPVTVRLQYRQAHTGPKIYVEEQTVQSPQRTNTTHFEIIGEDYCSRGAVTQWKATIFQDGGIVDEFESFLWQ